jgi:hypothetical protein
VGRLVYGSPVRRIVPVVVTVLVVGVVLCVLAAVRAGAFAGRGDDDTAGAGTPSATATSTAWLPVTTPEQVVDAFLSAVKAGSCPQQQFYVTRELLAASGTCTASTPSPHLRWSLSDASIDLVHRTATVPFEVSDVGSQEGRVFGLVLVGGQWRIDDFRAEATRAPATGGPGAGVR